MKRTRIAATQWISTIEATTTIESFYWLAGIDVAADGFDLRIFTSAASGSA